MSEKELTLLEIFTNSLYQGRSLNPLYVFIASLIRVRGAYFKFKTWLPFSLPNAEKSTINGLKRCSNL